VVPELGLFSLPLVLVPTERLPLHIFEPRYKELIGECIEYGEEFGILLAAAGRAEHEIGTRAAIAQVLETLPDGRMNIVVEGGDRFRVVDLRHDRSFTTATIEDVIDDDEPARRDDVARALELFRELAELTESEVAVPDRESPFLDFEIAARVNFGVEAKQELLELTSPRRRFARLAELLEHAHEAVQLDREVRKRAAGNGRVTPLVDGV
jgi:ATP-dependent Lon protease